VKPSNLISGFPCAGSSSYGYQAGGQLTSVATRVSHQWFCVWITSPDRNHANRERAAPVLVKSG